MCRIPLTRILLILLALSLSANDTFAGDKTPAIKIGETAPELTFRKLLQSPNGDTISRDSLKGNVVVLEFWATWCKGCVDAIPHMNALADKLADKPVRFIAVTGEDEATVQKFLQKKAIKARIGLDSDHSMSRAYGIDMIPRTVVIDRDGKIAGVTTPEQVTEQHLLKILAGKLVQFKPECALIIEDYIEEVQEHDQVPVGQRLFDLSIQPVKDSNKGGSASGFPGSYVAENASLRLILATAYDVRLNRVQGTVSILDRPFNVHFVAPTLPRDLATSILQNALCTTLCLNIRRENREVEAIVLSLPAAPGPNLKPPSENMEGFTDGKGIHCKNQTLDNLVCWLEVNTHEPVLDETGLKARFDYELAFDKNNPHATFKEIETSLGLKLTRLNRPVEYLVVDYATGP